MQTNASAQPKCWWLWIPGRRIRGFRNDARRVPDKATVRLTNVTNNVTNVTSRSPRAPFARALSEVGAGCGPRARINAIRSRAAPGPRSAGKKTGPHGACLTRGVVRRAGKTPGAPCLAETRFWSRAIGVIADGECRGEAPEGERALESGAQPRKRQLEEQCAFRRFASLFCWGVIFSSVVVGNARTLRRRENNFARRHCERSEAIQVACAGI
jgi:hypothetical protein